MDSSIDSRSALIDRIRQGIQKSNLVSVDLKKKNSRYIGVGIVTSALSTVIAGTAAAVGPALGQGPQAWKLTCAAVAVCTGIATVVTGLQRQLAIAEKLAKATSCSGKLHSLEFALTVNNRDTSEIAKEYEMVIASYPEIVL